MNFLKESIDELVAIDVIDISQVPDIALYMDQVTTFVEDNLSSYKRMPNDKLLTKTMINNYTKDGLIPPPTKKKYSKAHVLLLIMIYHLKSILSIADIGILINSINTNDIENIYNRFVTLERDEKKALLNGTMPLDLSLVEDKKTRVLLTTLSLTLQASYRKQLAEKLIDKHLRQENAE